MNIIQSGIQPGAKCAACGCHHDPEAFRTAKAAGTEQEICYAALLARLDELENQWRLLYREAYEAYDDQGMWEAQAHLRKLEKQRFTLRKPTVKTQAE